MGLKRSAWAKEDLVDTVRCLNLFLSYKPIVTNLPSDPAQPQADGDDAHEAQLLVTLPAALHYSGVRGLDPVRGKAGGGARVTAGPKRPHLSVCPGPNFPLQGRQGQLQCITGPSRSS